MVVNDGQGAGHLVVEPAGGLRFKQEIGVDQRCAHRLNPLARKPPSTGSTAPLVKLAASDARYTHAPANSSVRPKRAWGVRKSSSCPRSVPCNSLELSSVGNTPGAMALTHTPRGPHSTARDWVSATTPALLTPYAATS